MGSSTPCFSCEAFFDGILGRPRYTMDEAAMVRKPTAVVTTRPLCRRMLVQPYKMWDCFF